MVVVVVVVGGGGGVIGHWFSQPVQLLEGYERLW